MQNLISRSYKQVWLIAGLALIAMLLPNLSCAAGAGVDIVRDGKAIAVIVIPDKAIDSVQRAAWELQYHVKEASGATLEIVAESAEPQTKQGRIYLGVCKTTRQVGIVTDKLTRNGFIIKTVGKNIYSIL